MVNNDRSIQRLRDELTAMHESPREHTSRLLQRFDVTDIVNLLADEDPKIRSRAADAVVHVGDLYEASALPWMLHKGPVHGRIAAARVLGRMQDPAAIEDLVHATEDPSEEVRVQAKSSLISLLRLIGR